MKKFTLSLLLFAACHTLQAQYGHRTYFVDSLTNEWFNDGLITNTILAQSKPIYVACGKARSIAAGSFDRSRFTRVRFDGPVQHNRMYYVFKNGAELPSRLNSLCESDNAFVMSGAVTGVAASVPGTSDIMVMKTSATGIPNSLWKVDLGGSSDEALCTRRSGFKTNYYYTCGFSATPNVSSAFVMKHNSTLSTVSWVRKFNLPCASSTIGNAEATSVIDDPVTGSVIVVGNIRLNVAPVACQSAFIAKFSSGGALQWVRIVGTGNTNSLNFQSVRATDFSGEYIITGSIVLPGTGERVLLMRVNTNGAAPAFVFGRALLSPGPTPNFPVASQIGYDVVMRGSGTLAEYYISGVTNYTFGTSDGFLLKANAAGVPLALQLYYHDGNEALYAIDQTTQTGTPGDGIAAFGRMDKTFLAGIAPASRSWLVKSYFNLVTGCHEIADNPTSITLNVSSTAFTPTIATTFTKDSLQYQYGNALTRSICWATTVAGGSNLRSGTDGNEISDASLFTLAVFPNPVSSAQASVQISTTFAETAYLQVMDVMGRVVDDYSLALEEGTNEMLLETADLNEGIYLLQVTTPSGITKSIRFLKK